jgi:peptidoglycan hydrolase-like protein with peptidoglycan-binding domain
MLEKPPPVLSREQIRRLQIQLKEVGFDPGPANGVAGAKTKAAFVRFQSACAAWQLMHGKSTGAESSLTEQALSVSKQDVRVVQAQLRGAGFDSGPIDGIFGVRTKAAWLGVTSVCPTIGEFAGVLAYSSNADTKEKVVSGSAASILNTPVVHGPNGTDGTKQNSRPQPSQEQIRILQLRLRDAGFDPGPFDGVMGPKTKLARQQYEASQRGKKTMISVTANRVGGQY